MVLAAAAIYVASQNNHEKATQMSISKACSKYSISFLCCFCPAYTIPMLFKISTSEGLICNARL